MEINKEITVKITKDEISEIIKEYLKATKNIEIDSVRFNIIEEYDTYGDCENSELEGATCHGNLK